MTGIRVNALLTVEGHDLAVRALGRAARGAADAARTLEGRGQRAQAAMLKHEAEILRNVLAQLGGTPEPEPTPSAGEAP